MADLWWDVEQDYGHLTPEADFKYDNGYIQKYREYEKDNKAFALTDIRIKFVNTLINDDYLLDYGCGAGTFVKKRPNTFGFDVVPEVLDWLREKKLLRVPSRGLRNICFWDSLEHIEDPFDIFKWVEKFVFISTPIYKDCYSVITSKHFKPNEHIWYFTFRGLINYLKQYGFDFICYADIEKEIGRENIGTFAFKRKS